MVVKPDKKTKFLVRCCETLVFLGTKWMTRYLHQNWFKNRKSSTFGCEFVSHLNCIYICRKRIPLLLFLINIGFFRILKRVLLTRVPYNSCYYIWLTKKSFSMWKRLKLSHIAVFYKMTIYFWLFFRTLPCSIVW